MLQSAYFLGYPYSIKGYKLFDLNKKIVFVSCNVIFFENSFPFQTHTSSSVPSNSTGIPHPISDSAANLFSSSDSYISLSHIPRSSNDIPADSPITSAPDSHISVSSPADFPATIIFPSLPRRSTRTRTKPAYFQQYYCQATKSEPVFPLNNGPSSCKPHDILSYLSCHKVVCFTPCIHSVHFI